ncbi:conserved unknown protein [Ectocarpus siliculosus]|uniref:Methyltransferase domain-containing protein n=1 Tax=Ectocarpus siliculosus TaxID=2880 RepID=D7FLK1_ECTSI|nr:conserved unknown protein [Ectocarpus siliculosus]|eukprot:CBJ25817.1 conserved unknown protein [Ectocarpus siliculosus]
MKREAMASPADSKEKVGSVDGGVIEEKTSEDVAAEGVQSSSTATAAPPAAAAAAAAAPAAAASAGEPAPGEELTKVTVFNVGKHATLAQFEKILKNNSVQYKRAKKTPSITHGTLTFETAEQRAVAMEQLRKIVGARGGELMFAVLARQKQNNDIGRGNKRSARDGDDDGRGGDASKRPRQEAERKTVAQATASLYGVKTYPEQLAFKEKTLMDDLFLKLPIVIRNEWDKRFREWKRNQGMKQGGGGGTLNKPAELRCPAWCRMFKRRDGTVPFDVSPIVPAPEPEGYRNKCEFTLSLSEDGLATAGFRAGRFQAGVPITVESPKDCPQVHGDMKKLCVQMDAFMRSSPFPLYDDATKKGVWRLLVARRSAADKEGMAMVVINPTDVKDTEEWKKEEERLVKELSAGAQGEEGTKLVSLWVQEYAGLSSPDETSPMRLLWGKERLEEELLGLRFTISPNSFFQVNTKGAEALYKVVIENLELGDDAVVLDVCCGAGTIGICAAAAGGAKQVYGSDICLPAIEDARRNALANGIDNCEFVCGKAEAVVAGQIANAFKQHKASLGAPAAGAGEEGSTASPAAAPAATGELKFAAIVDPPRSGVHAKCLRSIRGTKAIKRLVYVSCNPTKSLAADATILCTPVSKSTTGLPFRPVKFGETRDDAERVNVASRGSPPFVSLTSCLRCGEPGDQARAPMYESTTLDFEGTIGWKSQQDQ